MQICGNEFGGWNKRGGRRKYIACFLLPGIFHNRHFLSLVKEQSPYNFVNDKLFSRQRLNPEHIFVLRPGALALLCASGSFRWV